MIRTRQPTKAALPGDSIRLVVSSDGKHADGQVIGTGTWTAHGDRQQIPAPSIMPRVYLPLVWKAAVRESRSWFPLILHDWAGHPADLVSEPEPFVSPIATPELLDMPEALTN